MSIPSQFQQFTINYYNGQDPYQNGRLTQEGEVLLSEFGAMLASISADQKQTAAQIDALYLQFLAQKTTTIRTSEESNALSPDEISQRHLVYNVYDILLTLLSTVTTNEIANTAVLNFLAEKQKIYSDMIGKTSMYIGTGTIYTASDSRGVTPNNPKSTADSTQTQVHSSATDASAFTLGFANISVDDISQYLTDQVFRQGQQTSSFDLYSDEWPYDDNTYIGERNHATMTLTNNGGGTYTATVSFSIEGRFRISQGTQEWGAITTAPPQTITLSSATIAQAVSALDSSFLSAYAYAKSQHWVEIFKSNLPAGEVSGKSALEIANSIAKRNIKIPYETGILAYQLSPATTNKSWTAALTKLQNLRSTYNKTLSTFIGEAEAKQQLLGDKASQQQQIIQTATSSRQMTNKILKNTIQQMATILQAIFR